MFLCSSYGEAHSGHLAFNADFEKYENALKGLLAGMNRRPVLFILWDHSGNPAAIIDTTAELTILTLKWGLLKRRPLCV
jgi:sensor domain CHASE-containing protein